uniref:Uncharacterized protein n=1 Tax=Castor canadensis TaxID=51338 RepID=A0A8C0WAH6_CASCN
MSSNFLLTYSVCHSACWHSVQILLCELGIGYIAGKWLMIVSQSVFCGTSTYCVLNTVPPIEDDHGNSNSSHVKIFLPKKLLECLPKCSSLPKEGHRWNTNEVDKSLFLRA